MNILHFVYDDKFIPFVQSVFEEAYPARNFYRVLMRDGGDVKFVIRGPNVSIVCEDYFTSDALAKDYLNIDCVVVHSMLPEFAEGVRRAPDRVLVIWSGWGFDYSKYIQNSLGSLLLPKTQVVSDALRRKALFRKILSLRDATEALKRRLRRRKLCGGMLSANGNSALEAIASRIDVFSVMPDEVAALRARIPALKAVYHMLHYYSVEDVFSAGSDRMIGCDILLGNSATPECNHFESFSLLKKMELCGGRLVVPLSYGYVDYADEVCRVGSKLFGDQFFPLRNFMPLNEYNTILESCGSVVMNHRRQQAIGNISAALYKGANVFLREESPVYKFYSQHKLVLNKMSDIESGRVRRFEAISDSDFAENRRKIGTVWGRRAVVESLRALKGYLELKDVH